MANFNPTSIIKSIGAWTRQHSPGILLGFGISGMATSLILTVRATAKAVKEVEEEKERDQVDELGVREIIRITWKNYIPAAAIFTGSTVCLISANAVNTRRMAALATAYSLSETALLEYRDKVIETVGERQEKKIREEVAQDHIKENPIENTEIIITGKGKTRCYDSMSGRYFESDKNTIDAIVNKLNREMNNNYYISLNDFYYELGLRPIIEGDLLGWNISEGHIEITYGAVIDDSGEPCLALDYLVAPRYDFKNLH